MAWKTTIRDTPDVKTINDPDRKAAHGDESAETKVRSHINTVN